MVEHVIASASVPIHYDYTFVPIRYEYNNTLVMKKEKID